jgi:Pvc16 N-terminal domain
MSNALAIATVTETLLHLLTHHLGVAQVPGATVTAVPPDSSTGLASPGVNIFLYQISPNPALRNADLPTRQADRSLLRRPQTALDLHYLLTFYGDPTRLEQERLFGAVALALHAHPVLPRALIQHVETQTPFLAGADLDQQTESIRFVPINFSLEELSKLWSFLLKIDYVLSAAYMASVVLIETDDATPPPALPVLAPNIVALPLRQPVINQILSAADPNAPIEPGSSLLLVGNNLDPPTPGATEVVIGGIAQTPSGVGPTRITVALPSGLAAGAQTAQITQSLALGRPAVPHPGAGFRSAIAAFVLHPVILSAVAEAHVLSPPGEAVEVKLDPAVLAGQRVALQLLPIAQPTTGQLFNAEAIAGDTDTLTIATPGLASGTYLVRVFVDGADSALELDPSGAPIAPTITV